MRATVRGIRVFRVLMLGVVGVWVGLPITAQVCGECTDQDRSWCDSHMMGPSCHQFETGDIESHQRGNDIHTALPHIGLGTCEQYHPDCELLAPVAVDAAGEAIRLLDLLRLEELLSGDGTTLTWVAWDSGSGAVQVLSTTCGHHAGHAQIVIQGWTHVGGAEAEFWERRLPRGIPGFADRSITRHSTASIASSG